MSRSNPNWSSKWKSSSKPSKQRKYQLNAPLHIAGKFLKSHLSDQLQEKLKTRTLRVRKGDTVRIMRGDFKGVSGTVESLNIKKCVVYVTSVERTKKDGSKARQPIRASAIEIIEIINTDKRRLS